MAGRWETAPFLRGGILDSPVIVAPLQGLLFPSPLREQELAQRVEAGHGQSLWRACVTWPPAPASFTFPGPAPSTHGAASSLGQKGGVRWVPLRPCSLFFDAQWHHPARILWGGGKDAPALHRIPWHELLLEGSCPPTGRDFSTREVI